MVYLLGWTGEVQLPARDQLDLTKLMSEVSQAPWCEKHQCFKVKKTDRRRKEGFSWKCKQCDAEASKRWRANTQTEEQKEQKKAEARERYAADPAPTIARTNAWRDANRDHVNKKRRWNRADQKQYDKKRWAENTEALTWERVQRFYGLTKEMYFALYESQGKVCACCGSPDKASKKLKHLPLMVDHCHETNVVRGLLCHGCNAGLGLFKDSSLRLQQAIRYLNGGNADLVAAVLHDADARTEHGGVSNASSDADPGLFGEGA